MLQHEHEQQLGGLRTRVVGEVAGAQLLLILLHGYAMTPEDLAPFAHSLGKKMLCLLPAAPHSADAGGLAWWPVNKVAREQALAVGPRDLADEFPAGREQARTLLETFLVAARGYAGCANQPVVLGGFSQGGMLVCDTVLLGNINVDAVALLSASRIAYKEWQPQLGRMARMPTLISHGHDDRDLAFAAGERLRDCLQSADAEVCWVPFDGQHTIPLQVWRALRKFLHRVSAGFERHEARAC